LHIGHLHIGHLQIGHLHIGHLHIPVTSRLEKEFRNVYLNDDVSCR
jgi:hypothetical protein